MKKLYFSLCFVFIGTFVLAQSNYEKSIQENSVKLQKANSTEDLDQLYQLFMNLTKNNTEKTWEAHYYAGLAMFKKAAVAIRHKDLPTAISSNEIAYKLVKFSVSKTKNNVEKYKITKKLLEEISNQSDSIHAF